MKVLIAAAKTGGHVYPAVSVATEFIENGHEVIFIGTNSLIEKEALKSSPQIHYESIDMHGYRGNGILRKLLVLLKLPLNIISLIRIILKNKVDSVIVFGGFISIPAYLASIILYKPLYVHEQNTVLGSANKIASKFAKKVFLGLPLHNNNIRGSELVGNPIRECFVPSKDRDNEKKIKIYVTGGSQGAKYLNDNLPALLNSLEYPIEIKHQCGKGKKDSVIDLYGNNNNIQVQEFYNDPNLLIDWCDFVISRSGALSISETISMQKGALMIPLPSAIDNHQFFNAKYIEDENMGLIHEEKDGLESLKTKITNILRDKKYLKWQEANKNINHRDAANKIFRLIEQERVQ